MHFAAVCGFLAVSLGIVGTYAQVRRVRRDGVAGVSPATWTLFCLMGGFWISYGLAVRSVPVWSSSVILLPMQLSVVSRLRPLDARVLARSASFFGLGCVAPALVLGWNAGVLGVGAVMIGTRMPQLLELVREPDASGVSAASWFFGVAGCALWVAYYASTGMTAALVATGAAGLASLVIASLAAWRHAGARSLVRATPALALD